MHGHMDIKKNVVVVRDLLQIVLKKCPLPLPAFEP
jgi:hypothetical protein